MKNIILSGVFLILLVKLTNQAVTNPTSPAIPDLCTWQLKRDEIIGKLSPKGQEAIKKIAEYLKSEVLNDLSPREVSKIKHKVQQAKSSIQEGLYEEEESDDLSTRKAKRREKAMIGGGLGTMATGAVLSLGEFMGYSEFEITSMLHDFNKLAGLERYTGPVTLGMVFLGLVLALKGVANKHSRENP